MLVYYTVPNERVCIMTDGEKKLRAELMAIEYRLAVESGCGPAERALRGRLAAEARRVYQCTRVHYPLFEESWQ